MNDSMKDSMKYVSDKIRSEMTRTLTQLTMFPGSTLPSQPGSKVSMVASWYLLDLGAVALTGRENDSIRPTVKADMILLELHDMSGGVLHHEKLEGVWVTWFREDGETDVAGSVETSVGVEVKQEPPAEDKKPVAKQEPPAEEKKPATRRRSRSTGPKPNKTE